MAEEMLFIDPWEAWPLADTCIINHQPALRREKVSFEAEKSKSEKHPSRLAKCISHAQETEEAATDGEKEGRALTSPARPPQTPLHPEHKFADVSLMLWG